MTTFRKLSEIGEWAKQTQGKSRAAALHVDLTATLIQKTLAKSAGKRGLGQAVANFKARRAVRQYRRAAAHIDAAADCIGKGWADIQQQFAELINPRQTRDFNWQG